MLLKMCRLLVFLFLHYSLANFNMRLKDNERMILERIEVLEVNPDLVKLSARVNKINKTDYALNANFTLMQDPMPPMILKIEVHALFSNEYRPMPLALAKNMCDIYKIEYKWIEEEMTKNSHVPSRCPIRKGDWYIKNFIPDTRKFPFVSPWDNIRMRFHYYEIKNSKTLTLLDLYLRKAK